MTRRVGQHEKLSVYFLPVPPLCFHGAWLYFLIPPLPPPQQVAIYTIQYIVQNVPCQPNKLPFPCRGGFGGGGGAGESPPPHADICQFFCATQLHFKEKSPQTL